MLPTQGPVHQGEVLIMVLQERWYAADADIARHCGEKPEAGSQVRRFVPFGDGSRKCIGGELGRVSVIATLARFFSNFRFRLADQVGSYISHTCRLWLFVLQMLCLHHEEFFASRD